MVVYALLAANDGETLQGDVTKSILGVDKANSGRISTCRNNVKKLVLSYYPVLDRDDRAQDYDERINNVIGKIVKVAFDPPAG